MVSGRARSGFEMADHPADLRFRVWAPDRETLFRQAARALLALLFPDGESGGIGDGGGTAEVAVRLEGVDADDLLVRWLGELLFQAETRRLAPAAIDFLQLDEGQLRADCTMRRTGPPSREIKAVTYHQTGIGETGEGLEATLLLDV